MTSGSFGSLIGGARVCGNSTGTPTVNSGAVTMKTTSSTSMTSTSGVTLMSDIGRWRPWPLPLAWLTAIGLRPLVELAREDRAERGGEGLEPARIAVEVGRQLVVGDDGRDRRDEAERGCEQRLGDAGRD